MVRAIAEGADAVAVVGENRKMLVFPLPSCPSSARGQGVTLQRYRDGGLSRRDRVRASPTGLAGRSAARAAGCGPRRDLTPWRAARGAAGRMPPIGFPRSNRFD